MEALLNSLHVSKEDDVILSVSDEVLQVLQCQKGAMVIASGEGVMYVKVHPWGFAIRKDAAGGVPTLLHRWRPFNT